MVPQRPESAPRSMRLRPLHRILVNVLLDAALAAIAAPLARWLAAPQDGLLHPLWFLASGAITLVISGLPFRMPQQYWRFSGMGDLLGIAGASIASAALFTLGLTLTGFKLPSASFPVIYALVLLVLLGGLRAGYRLFYGIRRRQGAQRRVILVGADQTADLFLRAISRNTESVVSVIGIVAQSSNQAGRRINNVPILGHVNDIVAILGRLAAARKTPNSLVVTDANFRGEALGHVLDAAEAHGIEVMRAPVLTALTPADRVELRPVALEELLNRPQVALDRAGMERLIAGRVVAVTGAGGSIGSELARQVAGFGPSRLILIDNNEFALWQIDLDIGEQAPPVPRSMVVGDVRDADRINAVFAEYRPALIFHAAALKHVPIVEANPCEGLLTNVLGTRIVADAGGCHGAQAMVVISTDKAVNPSSLMGASKRAAEMYCQALDIVARTSGRSDAMRCITVRFGNVLGSRGSVVPLFQRQLEHGGPLTVTHPEMRRYFMTIPEAVGLVLQATVRGAAEIDAADLAPEPGADFAAEAGSARGETELRLRGGGIFVLDMGEPVRIVDLARRIIRLAGLRPDEDISIEFTGLRPGEKLYEELFHGREAPVPTDAPGLLIAMPRVVDRAEVDAAVARIAALSHAGDAAGALAVLHALVPEFDHNPLGEARGAAPAENMERIAS